MFRTGWFYRQHPKPPPTPAFLICLRSNGNDKNEWTQWPSEAEAIQAEAELCHPCGPKCQRGHILVAYDDGKPRIIPTPPMPPDDELPPGMGDLLNAYPTPEEWNPPLDAPHGPAITTQRIQRGQTIDLLRQLATVAT